MALKLLGFWLLASIAMGAAQLLEDALDHHTFLCANDNTPICARTRSEYLLFKNECHMRKAQRENLMGELFEVALRYCVPSCEFQCDISYQPICGVSVETSERKTFDNRCEMARTSCLSKADWLVYKWGVCPSGQAEVPQHTVYVGQRQSKQREPIPCTNVYRPVCAIYAGVKSTFTNECLVNAENIRTKRNWRIISEGLCGEDSTKLKHSRKFKPKAKPKTNGAERTKRSHKKLSKLEDFEMADDVVQIFAPSTFHTQFISNTGTLEKSYSLPARQPAVSHRSKPRVRAKSQHCVFSNEPVCGSFNGESRTFPNVCALMEYSQQVGNAWTILYDGACRNCDFSCPTDYNPICTSKNGLTYTIMNECYLERVRCKDPKSAWKIKYQGECALPTEEVSESIATAHDRSAVHTPQKLYAAKRRFNGNMTMPAIKNRLAQRVRPLEATTPRVKHLKTTARVDSGNRKIRKIAAAGYSGYDAVKSNRNFAAESTTSRLYNSNNNLYQGKNSGKSFMSIKFKLPLGATTSQPILATTTEASAGNTKVIVNNKPIYKVDKLNPKFNFMHYSTTARAILAKELGVTQQSSITTESTTATTKPLVATTTTTEIPITTVPTTIRAVPAQKPSQPSTTNAPLTTARALKPAGNDLATDSPNLDYVTDEPQLESKQDTSIYGLNKNSLIMRLLRARSSLKNVVL